MSAADNPPALAPRPRVDLNADAGEGFEERELFRWISTASVACGGHAGDDASMRATLDLARANGVAVGAHPGYEDRDRFGRVELGLAARAVRASVGRQLAALSEVAARAGVPLAHVKPHGALYHRAATDTETAAAVAEAIAAFDGGLAVISSPGSRLLEAAATLGLRAQAEGFVDRRYLPNGHLAARSAPDALLRRPEAVEQALALGLGLPVRTSAGEGPRFDVQTLCLHSDSPDAAVTARAVRQGLEAAGFEVLPAAPAPRVTAIPQLLVVGAAIVAGPRVLVARRGAAMSAPGLWELPGGKVRPGEAAGVALAREVFEELGLSIEIGAHLGHGSALVDGRRIRLEAFLARLAAGEDGRLELREHDEARWVVAEDLGTLEWSEADEPILPRLLAALAVRENRSEPLL